MFRPLCRLLAGLLGAALPLAAQGGAAWLCAVSEEGTRLVCVADVGPADAALTAATTAVVRGTRFPLQPTALYVVDFWSPPIEPEFVRELARATLCYRSPGCTATVAPGPWMNVAPARDGRRAVAVR